MGRDATGASGGTSADIALVDRIIARDPSAIAELYDRYSRLLFGLIFRILKERGEAEDVLQEVFLSVWRRAESYSPSLGSPVGWLVGIARNRSIDRLRANSVRLRAMDVSFPPPLVDNPESQAAREERQRDVTRALRALPAEQRTLIEEAYFLGLTHSELAARFCLPLGTVKTRVRTGMVALRQQLQENVVI
jgi:RNA polymerase sigma-70 factor (ECF subfamily)